MNSRKLGPYRIEGRLGAGGMGEVFRAYDDRLERWVAIKLIRPEAMESVEARRRFRREARAAARLSHPAIVQIHDILEGEEGDSIVMELVEGRPLSRLLAAGRPELGRALELAREIAEGLAEAHDKGVVHRDLKADNVMITPSGHAKILDFGLAKRLTQAESDLSIDGKIFGTVHAMSPEQAQGFPVDRRSDLFSLGTLLYELFTGRSPFRMESAAQTLSRIVTHKQPPAREVDSRVPDALSALLDCLLEKDPLHRPQAADAVVSTLKAVTLEDDPPGRGTATAPVVDNDLFQSPTRMNEAGSSGSEAPAAVAPSKLRLYVWLSTAAVALVLVGLFGARWLPRDDPGPTYVAVLGTQVGTATETHDLDLVAAGVRLAVARALASFEDVATLAFDQVDRVSGSSAEVARALAADEVVASTLDCRTEGRPAFECRVVLSRVRGGDSTVVWFDDFPVPIDDLKTLTHLVAEKLRGSYHGTYDLRPGVPELDVPSSDVYEDYLRLRRNVRVRPEGVTLEALLEDVRAIESSSPRFLEAYLLEARIALLVFNGSRRSADLERAFDAVQRARNLAREDPRPLFILVNIALESGLLDRAEAALEDLKRLEGGHARVLAQEALVLEGRGDTGEALRRMRTAVRRHPSSSNLFDLIQMELRRGEVASARTHLAELHERSPQGFMGRFLEAQIELLYGDPREAADLYAGLVRQAPGVGVLTNHGVAFFLLDRHEEAAGELRRALQFDPGSPQATLYLAEAERALGNEGAVEALCRQALDLVDRSPGATTWWWFLATRARAQACLGQDHEAIESIMKTLRLAPDSPIAAWEAALVYAALGEKKSAEVQVSKALRRGMGPQWFTAAWFALRDDPELRALLDASS